MSRMEFGAGGLLFHLFLPRGCRFDAVRLNLFFHWLVPSFLYRQPLVSPKPFLHEQCGIYSELKRAVDVVQTKKKLTEEGPSRSTNGDEHGNSIDETGKANRGWIREGKGTGQGTGAAVTPDLRRNMIPHHT